MVSFKIQLLLTFGGVILFTLLLIFVIPNIGKNSLCNAEKRALRLSIENGILVKKYRDLPNHNYETIRYKVKGEEIESLIFVLDQSGCYDFLQEGDLLNKKENSLTFIVRRHSIDSLFVLEYGCEH